MSDPAGTRGPSPFFSLCLDHLRWFSAMVVLLGHARSFLFGPMALIEDPGPMQKAFYLVTNFQNEAVLGFFVISGYLIGGKLIGYWRAGEVPLRDYIIDRSVRLYIVLLPSMALVYAVAQAGFCKMPDNATWLGTALYVQHLLVEVTPCNIPLWSLANEFWYYAIGLLAVVAAVRSRLAGIVGLAVVTALLAFDEITRENILICLPIWLLGALLTFDCVVRRVRVGLLPAVAFLVAALVASRGHFLDDHFALRDGAVGFGVFLVLAQLRDGVGTPGGERLAAFGRFMASFSFSLYLVHWPCLMLIRGLMRRASWPVPLDPDNAAAYLTYGTVCAMCLAVAWAIAWISEYRTARVRAWMRGLVPGAVA